MIAVLESNGDPSWVQGRSNLCVTHTPFVIFAVETSTLVFEWVALHVVVDGSAVAVEDLAVAEGLEVRVRVCVEPVVRDHEIANISGV